MTLKPYEDAPFQRFHRKLVAGATAGYISDGYTLGVVGIALAVAQAPLDLTPAWLGAVGSSSLAGLFLGALISGWAADRFGRRRSASCNRARSCAFWLRISRAELGWRGTELSIPCPPMGLNQHSTDVREGNRGVRACPHVAVKGDILFFETGLSVGLRRSARWKGLAK